jgi:E3 ubiquitin-protein ligase RAD18
MSSWHHREKADPELDTPIPKASYTVLKDKQIRDLLAAHDLSKSGDRSQLIARHERSVSQSLSRIWNRIIMRPRWVAVYNANLDRSPALRKRAAELRSEMQRWEEDKRALRKEPLKTDITEYRVRTCLLSLGGLRHNQAIIVARKQSRV